MSIFRSPERDAAIDALLAADRQVGLGGGIWRLEALRTHVDPDADLLFPGGAAEMIEVWLDLADRRMGDAAQAHAGEGLARRVRALVLARLASDAPHRDAVRRALAILAMPANAGLAARALARTTDAIWREAGDRAADFSWYTKRATLAAIYMATRLYWLDPSRSDEDVAAFLDRRLAGVARIGRLRRRLAPRPSPPPASPSPPSPPGQGRQNQAA